MTEQYTPNLGELCKDDARRDAVHIACAPVKAAYKLLAGDHVSLNEQGEATTIGPFIGIVDPFLKRSVQKGETFWLFLYPGSITGLRHMWTHPAFATKVMERKESEDAR